MWSQICCSLLQGFCLWNGHTGGKGYAWPLIRYGQDERQESKVSCRCRDRPECGRGLGVQQAWVSMSRPGRDWGGSRGQGLEGYGVSKAMTRNKEGREGIRQGLACQREEYGLYHVGTREPQRTVGSAHPSQVCFKRAPQVPCGGWVCGWERSEAGDPIVRVQERADKARAGGEWSGFQGTLRMLWRQRERRGWKHSDVSCLGH